MNAYTTDAQAAAPAWLLRFSDDVWAAFAVHSTLAIVDQPAHDFIPGAPPHCLGLMRWEKRRLPLIDLSLLDCGIAAEAASDRAAHALVLAWQDGRDGAGVDLGAIAAPSRVSKILVSDADQCAAPEGCGMLRRLAASWFLHDGRPVAVVDTSRLFSGWIEGVRHDVTPASNVDDSPAVNETP